MESGQRTTAAPPIDAQDLDEVCVQIASLWDGLRGQRIFLSGGTGFFGCWLVESFVEANRRFNLQAEMTVLTRSPESFQLRCPHLAEESAVVLLRGDVRSFAPPDGEFAFVIHAAAETGGAENAALRTLSTIFDGTRAMLDFAASHGTRRFLIISSGAIYGIQPAELAHVPESYTGGPNPCLPSSAYAEGKRAAEALCSAYASPAMVCTIARCFAFVGPHLALDGNYAIGNFIRSVLRSEMIRLTGDGTPLRSYLYASDLTVWLWTLLMRGPLMQPINVGSDRIISIRELAEEVRAALGSRIEIEVLGTPRPGALPARYVPSIERAETNLGLKQMIGLREAIQRTAAWHGWQRSAAQHIKGVIE